MNCEYFRDQIYFYFGDQELPNDIADHIKQCPACHAFWIEMNTLATSLPNDTAFSPDSEQVDMLTDRVRRTINDTTDYNNESDSPFSWFIHGIEWSRALSAAAAVVLFVGVGIVSYMYGQSNNVRYTTDDFDSGESVSLVLSDNESDEPDHTTLKVLMYDFTTSQTSGAGERLLDDITEEEYKYLENSFDVGDIL